MDSDLSVHARSPPRLINPFVNMDSSYCRHLASGDAAAGGQSASGMTETTLVADAAPEGSGMMPPYCGRAHLGRCRSHM